MSVYLLRGDALAVPLADDSVDLIVTSPPYFALRSYTDGGEHYAGQIGSERSPHEFLEALIAATREMIRVLKPSGSIWINLGDKYAAAERGPDGSSSGLSNGAQFRVGRGRKPSDCGVPRKSLIGIPWRYAIRCIDELGLILRAEVIWSKSNGLPEAVADRVRRSHEQWFHFTLERNYYSDIDEIRVPYASKTFSVGTTPRRSDEGSAGDKRNKWHADNGVTRADMLHPKGALPGSVWEIATQPLKVPAELGVDHFAAYPMEGPRRIIKGWCPPGGVVLDPFGGTGTTALMAEVLGRRAISVDMSHDYCRIAQWRTTDPGQRAAAMQVPKPPAVMPGMASLFDQTIAEQAG